MKKTAKYMGHTLAVNLLTFVKYFPAVSGRDVSELSQKLEKNEIPKYKEAMYMYVSSAVTGDPKIRSMYESKGYDAVEEYLASEIDYDDFEELNAILADLYGSKKN